jgi:hypothetical protein
MRPTNIECFKTNKRFNEMENLSLNTMMDLRDSILDQGQSKYVFSGCGDLFH